MQNYSALTIEKVLLTAILIASAPPTAAGQYLLRIEGITTRSRLIHYDATLAATQ